MKQALIALIRDTFAGTRANAERSEQHQDQCASAMRTLSLAELRQVSGGVNPDVESPKRGW